MNSEPVPPKLMKTLLALGEAGFARLHVDWKQVNLEKLSFWIAPEDLDEAGPMHPPTSASKRKTPEVGGTISDAPDLGKGKEKEKEKEKERESADLGGSSVPSIKRKKIFPTSDLEESLEHFEDAAARVDANDAEDEDEEWQDLSGRVKLQYDHFASFELREAAYQTYSREFPDMREAARRATREKFPGIDGIPLEQRMEIEDDLLEAQVHSRPGWMGSDEDVPEKLVCYVTNAGGDNRNPSRRTVSWEHDGVRRSAKLYSYQWVAFLRWGVVSGQDHLVVSHLCHNPKCHRRDHLVLEPQDLNNFRNTCLKAMKGKHRFTKCSHVGVGCFKRKL
jgi:hypothetical protein